MPKKQHPNFILSEISRHRATHLGESNDLSSFADWYQAELNRVISVADGCRQPHWSESIAVGSRSFVDSAAALSKNRKKLVIQEWAENAWYVREPAECYETIQIGLPQERENL
jgi:hypothetical protein